MAQDITSTDLQELIKTSSVPIIVDFWAPWCGPCRAQGPIVDKWSEKHGDKVSVYKLNVDDNGDLATKLGITSIPTIITFAGGDEKARGVGVQDESALDSMLSKV
ncbi:MAG: thioredoxin [Pirellulales bacterium]|nr:thioredoxin [Pirellulales bacterium]